MARHSRLNGMALVATNGFWQFCLNTSLHGWKYLALPKTTKFERYGWLAVCLVSISISIYLLSSAWVQFQSDPTVTVTESTQHPIYKFAFPAVTICSFNTISKRAAHKMAKGLKAPNTYSLMNGLKMLFHLVENGNRSGTFKSEFEDLHRIIESNGKTVEEVFEAISPSCNGLLKRCIWKGEDKHCDILFQKVRTFVGYCCSFNYFALKHKYLNSHFSKKLPKSPRQISSCGFQSGLEVLIDNDPDDYLASYLPSIGFKVQIHYPYDFPDGSGSYVLCEINTTNFIGVNPDVIRATDDTKARPVSERNCLFSNERDLAYFVQYSFHNCMVECKIALVLQLCGCVPFYVNKTTEFPACTLNDVPCIVEIEDIVQNETILYEKACYCLPDCETTWYDSEASKGALDASHCTNQFSIYSNADLTNHTIIRVFFNDLLGTKYRRDVLFTWPTLMGYYGGILGLFTGFSFISLVEILYFCLIKCFAHGDPDRKKFKNLLNVKK